MLWAVGQELERAVDRQSAARCSPPRPGRSGGPAGLAEQQALVAVWRAEKGVAAATSVTLSPLQIIPMWANSFTPRRPQVGAGRPPGPRATAMCGNKHKSTGQVGLALEHVLPFITNNEL